MQVIYITTFLLLIILCTLPGILTYKIPNVALELLKDGFRVSIPDEEGVQNVAFNINRNRPFKTFSQGEISVQIPQATDNYWSYENRRKLEQNDVLYIWINVQYKQFTFRRRYDPIPVKLFESTGTDTNNESSSQNRSKTHEITTDNSSCTLTITVSQYIRNICKGQLIFEDNFNTVLDQNRWTQEVLLPLDTADDEFVVYDTIAVVSDGLLNIVPTLWNGDKPNTDIRQGELNLGARCTAKKNPAKECRREKMQLVHTVLPPVITSRINTRNSFSFKYGRIEVRAKIPQGDWLFPLILLEPVENYYGNNAYDSGQLRIAFARGNINLVTENNANIDGRVLYGGAVLSTNSDLRNKFMVETTRFEHFGNRFHTYSLIWNNAEIIFEVDDQEYGRITGNFQTDNQELVNLWKTTSSLAPFDREFFITLGVAAGGHGDFPDGCLSNNRIKPWENTSPKATYQFWAARNNWKPTWTNPGLQTGIKKVFYIVEINEMCPAHMDYIQAANGGTWSFEKSNVKLQENDKISVSLMVQHMDDVHINTEYIKIKNNQAVSINCSSSTDVLDRCETTETTQVLPDKPCKRSQSVTQNGIPRCEGDLLFEDNFDGDLKRWDYEIRLGFNEEEEFVLFNDAPENCFISDGILNIVPTIAEGDIRRESVELGDKCTPMVSYENECGTSTIDVRTQRYKIKPPINAAQINTRNSFNFKYGRIEIRAKLPKGDWIIPHILLKPVSAVSSYRVPQMYIALARGNVQLIKDDDEDISGSRLYGGNIVWQYTVNRIENMRDFKGKEHFGDAFHTYSLTWTRDRLSVAVDGVSYGDITESMSLFQQEFYILLGVSVGGHFDFPDKLKNHNKPWENTEPKAALDFWRKKNNWKNSWNGGQGMQIDYVRVYAV